MPEQRRFGIDEVREFARQQVERTSLRDVAQAVGMSYSGLFSFLKGGEPYRQNRRKLLDWFARTRDTSAVPRDEEVGAAVALLRAYVWAGRSAADAKSRARRVLDQLLEKPMADHSSHAGKADGRAK